MSTSHCCGMPLLALLSLLDGLVSEASNEGETLIVSGMANSIFLACEPVR
uniref:Uncharacterized protein n=1 Tax=Desulfovibrio sp. U5L TaxID=596152 RepID=I2Q7M6_9BACT